MSTEQSKIDQSNYTLNILGQEYQYILAQHPIDVSMDSFSWMMIGMPQVWKCLQHIKEGENFETILALWNRQIKLIEKFATIRRIKLSPEFMEVKLAIENQLLTLSKTHAN